MDGYEKTGQNQAFCPYSNNPAAPEERAMKGEKNIKSYTAAELKARRARSRTDLGWVEAQTDAELERLVAEDEDGRGIRADWTEAKLVLPQAEQ